MLTRLFGSFAPLAIRSGRTAKFPRGRLRSTSDDAIPLGRARSARAGRSRIVQRRVCQTQELGCNLLYGGERLLDIPDEIIRGLDTEREPNQSVTNASPFSGLWCEHRV
jgi:hypothetical protein